MSLMIFFAQVLKEQGRYKTCWDGTEMKCLPFIYPRAFLLPPPPDMKAIKPQSCESPRKKWATFLHHETWRKTGKLPYKQYLWWDEKTEVRQHVMITPLPHDSQKQPSRSLSFKPLSPYRCEESTWIMSHAGWQTNAQARITNTVLLHKRRCWWSKQRFATL